MFIDSYLPNCLVIGISEEAFWNMNVSKLKPYIKADELRRDRANYELWLEGAYFYNAMSVVMANAFGKGKKAEYLEEPFALSESERQRREERSMQKAINAFTQMAEQLNQNRKNQGGE